MRPRRAGLGRAGPALSLDRTGSNPSRPSSHSGAGGTRLAAPASGGADGALSSRRKRSRGASHIRALRRMMSMEAR
ncbi:hypothetical protein PY32053_00061 [Paracoccus yeei]|uniref:Uncharacterized protein n=1 Tax=Paracoccus yeei TaxID=147645 RepID=A0A386UII4_9RHOB|nr:hypothetical protein PY32053_00061 [Paracoccus yeei]